MSTVQNYTTNKIYYTVIDGTFRTKASEYHPEAVRREYENRKTGAKGVKYETIHKVIFGKVESVQVYEGENGKSLQITLDPNEETGKNPVMTFSLESYQADDLLKKLPNMQPNVEYRFMPYALMGDTGKENKGMSVYSKDDEGKFTTKVEDAFTAKIDGKWTYSNGYPEPDEDDKSDWKFYFTKARKFMVKYNEEHVFARFNAETNTANNSLKSQFDYPSDEIKAEDIPF